MVRRVECRDKRLWSTVVANGFLGLIKSVNALPYHPRFDVERKKLDHDHATNDSDGFDLSTVTR